MSDKELLSLRKDISLIDAMITSKLSEIREAELDAGPETLADLVAHLALHWQDWDDMSRVLALSRLRDAVSRRRAEAATYDRNMRSTPRRRRSRYRDAAPQV